jgi:putative tryptophan/tyrosine transport system substrate-binding protein
MWSTSIFAEKHNLVLIISGSNEPPYQEVIQGFKQRVSTDAKATLNEMTLSQAQASGDNTINTSKPAVIFALGTDAAKWAAKQTSSIPIVTTMVLKDDVVRQSSTNMTGVSLSYTMQTQFQWLKKIFPQQKTIAILFNPDENNSVIKEAERASQMNGFKLNPIPVATPKELPYALEQLEKNIDILMAIPDETVMSVNTAKEVLLASFRNKVPLIGVSDNWVKSGAFYALSWDYTDLGLQCADQVIKLLSGTPVRSIPPERPRKVTYTINTKIAEHMNIDIPENLLKNAKMVFN